MERGISTREAYGQALVELGRANPNVVVLDADLSKSTMTALFAKEFPERFFNFGVAEANMVSVAAGLATCGKIPFVSTFAVFLPGRTYDQVRMSICYSNTNVKLVASHGGLSVGEDGASHQSLEDIALARVLPRMVVVVPADGIETKKAVFAAVSYTGPVYIRVGRPKVPFIYNNPEECRFEIGKGIVLSEGEDVGIIACGMMVHKALLARELLANRGYRACVVNLHTIKPIDKDLIVDIARRCRCIVTVEEHSIIGGLGSAVSEVVAESYPVPVLRVGVEDKFGESGKPEELFAKYKLTEENIVRRAEMAISMRRGF